MSLPSVSHGSSKASEIEWTNFNLRDAAAEITVSETSFGAFLAALRKVAKK